MRTDLLSGRARATLACQQYRVAVQLRAMHAADRLLSGALAACDAAGQRETLEVYMQTVQELRVAVQRLEDFLMRRITDPHGHDRADGVEPASGRNAEVRRIR